MAARPAVLDVGGQVAAGTGALGQPGRADADAALTDLAARAHVAARPAVLDVGGQVAAGTGAVGQPGRADADAALTDLAARAHVATGPAVLRVIGWVATGSAATQIAGRAGCLPTGAAVGRVAGERPTDAGTIRLSGGTTDAPSTTLGEQLNPSGHPYVAFAFVKELN